jgi:hypothetical protein
MISLQHTPTQPAPNLLTLMGREQAGQMTLAEVIISSLKIDLALILDPLSIDRFVVYT